MIRSPGFKAQLLHFLLSGLRQVSLQVWDLAFSSGKNAVMILAFEIVRNKCYAEHSHALLAVKHLCPGASCSNKIQALSS